MKKHHGTVDESSAEQQFCKLDTITFVLWSHAPSASGSYSRQSDKILVELEIFKILYRSLRLDSCIEDYIDQTVC